MRLKPVGLSGFKTYSSYTMSVKPFLAFVIKSCSFEKENQMIHINKMSLNILCVVALGIWDKYIDGAVYYILKKYVNIFTFLQSTS